MPYRPQERIPAARRSPAADLHRSTRRAAGPRLLDRAGGPARRPGPRRLRRRRHQGGAPDCRATRSVPTDRRRTATACGGRRSPQQALHRPVPRRSRGRRALRPTRGDRPTCSSRTSGPERSRNGASAGTCCSELNPRLVLVRVTGFGQSGPYRDRPGFGTLAEAMSGFAAITGEPDGPPTLPSMGLADSIAGMTAVSADDDGAVAPRPPRRVSGEDR